MAPLSGSSHSFQKLKLDTQAAPKSQQAASTFASFPRHDSQQNGSVRPQLGSVAPDDPDQGLYTTRSQDEDRRANGRVLGYDDSDGDGAVVVSGSDEEPSDDIEAQFRKRTTSISFSNEVTLDTGNRLSIEDPLPRPARARARHGDDHSDDEYLEMPFEHRPRRLSHHVGEPRWPLLQSTVDDLATDPEYRRQNPVASLTSRTTASPMLGVRTPVDLPSEYALSPLSASSPIEFPTFISQRNGSQRSRSHRDLETEGSYPKFTSRRSSTRSGRSLSSMSPAASFLAMYRKSDAQLKPPEPDEEGQGIGYHGEYIIGKQIGFGGFSVVKEVITIEDGQRVVHAVKIVRKQQNDKTELENEQIQTQLDHEVEIWRFLRHPYILPLLRVYTTDFATFCITRLNKGGTLFDLVRLMRRNKKTGLSAHLVKRYSYQLASAMRYLHNDVMIVHRDIKLENCLIDMSAPNAEVDGGNILLCDFGMADFAVSDQRDGPEPHSIGANQNIGPADTSTSVVGSLQYAAPELFDAPSWVFSTAADIWAFGVVVYALLTARLPFNEGMDAKTTMKILNGEWDVDLIRTTPAAKESKVEDAIELVKGCLDMDPHRRWNINDVLTCAWLRGCAEKYENKSCSWIPN